MKKTGAFERTLEELSPGSSVVNDGRAGEFNCLRMVLLGDDQGAIQLVCRKNDLVDIEQINAHLGRQLQVVGRPESPRFGRSTGVVELPTLANFTHSETVVDPQVDQLSSVRLELGEQGRTLHLSGEDFQSLTEEARRIAFAVSVGPSLWSLNDSERDQKEFRRAITKFTGLRIQQRIKDILEFPPLPETAQRIVHLRMDPNTVMDDLVDVVESDPALAAQVFSWASSSPGAPVGQVRSVHDAVSRVLGFELVMNMALGLVLKPSQGHHPEGYMESWQQAIWQAQAAGLLCTLMPSGKRPLFGLAYLSGLLHNFGFLVLGHVFPPHLKLVCRSLEANPNIDSSVIEQYLLGITREQIGALLMENWGMPEEVASALRYQKHSGYDGRHSVYAKLLWLGRQLLVERGLSPGASEPVPAAVFESLGLDEAKVHARFDELVAKKDTALAMAGMMAQ
ncbi:aminoacyl-tRNA deacylase and HDOD domain-containing protein [Marinobacter sp. F4216]|uniref:aminoacyl-tRNA deacylase and HDOD domain-containing protein n=1 Tax=Marinobacter sp. F4216 TaxID=2874281 RepID=UPI001CBFE4D6|nr:HDOD domain-containing protein [Marinobacter sp. F4216]